MAKTKVTIEQLLKEPLDYLYIFASDKFLSYISPDKRKIIKQKKANQTKYLNTVAIDNGYKSYLDVLDKVKTRINTIYGMTPQKMLEDLALGKNVAGKNWNRGIYGVSGSNNAKTTTFSQNLKDGTNITVGKDGQIMDNGTPAQGQTAIYKTNTKGESYIAGYSAIINGRQYSSGIDEQIYLTRGTANYYASTYATADEQQFANGDAYTSDEASSVWQSISTYLPMIIQAIQWIISMFKDLKFINKENTAPSQEEWIEDEPATSNLSKIALIAAVGAGVYYLAKK